MVRNILQNVFSVHCPIITENTEQFRVTVSVISSLVIKLWPFIFNNIFFRVRLLTTACVLYLVHSYPNFRESIPNGFNVPNPCNADDKWLGVGHEARGGGGIRNPFGLDFAAQGYVSTPFFILSCFFFNFVVFIFIFFVCFLPFFFYSQMQTYMILSPLRR